MHSWTSQTTFITLRGYYHDVIEQQVIHHENDCGYNSGDFVLL